MTKRFVILFLMTALFLSGAVFYETLSLSAAPPVTVGEIPLPQSADFLRTDASGEPVALMTPIVTFERLPETTRIAGQGAEMRADDMGLCVDLIATVHFADADYYRRLNERIPNYDVVLVELVAPKGAALAGIAAAQKNPPSKSGSLLSLLERFQKGVGRSLGFVNQLDAVDYAAPNMILADIDAETLFQRVAESGELRNELHGLISGENDGSEVDAPPESLVRPNKTRDSAGSCDDSFPEPDFWKILFARDRRSALRSAFAVELTRSLFTDTLFENSLIHERNRIALDELRNQVATGKRRVAILYGAAHLPDMAARLESDFGLTPTRVEWFTAWRLAD